MTLQPDRTAIRSAANSRNATLQAVVNRIRKAVDGDARPPSVPASSFSECFRQGYQGQRGRLAIDKLTSETCHFPIDQRRGPVRYCGLKVKPGSSYCDQHGQRCFGRWT